MADWAESMVLPWRTGRVFTLAPRGRRLTMRTFLLLWLGENVSLLGSQLAGFALGLWIYQRTGSATLYGLMFFAHAAPVVLASPFAGVLVDRWGRRRALLAAHAGAGVCSLVLVVVFALGALHPVLLMLLLAIAASFHSMAVPAFAAATTTLVPPRELGRANGIAQLGFAIAQISAPMAGAWLLSSVGLGWILFLDVASFVFAVIVLLSIRVPEVGAAAEATGGGSRMEQIVFGFRYIWGHPGLLALLLVFMVANFTVGMAEVLFTPLVLGFTDAKSLGRILSVGGVGMLAGSAVMVAWGGPARKILGVLGFVLLQGLFLFAGAAKPSERLAMAGVFGVLFAFPVAGACSQTIWQRKVPKEVQGRVFAARMAIAGGSMPLAFLLAGPLCDRLFEPIMAPYGMLASSVGRWLGTGPGRGAALQFVVLGVLLVLSALAGYAYRPLRRIEDDLPDVPQGTSGEALTQSAA
jgi:MFS transporter, DHA3 family, macrolide efflux protein